jgi:hypothetical protein
MSGVDSGTEAGSGADSSGFVSSSVLGAGAGVVVGAGVDAGADFDVEVGILFGAGSLTTLAHDIASFGGIVAVLILREDAAVALESVEASCASVALVEDTGVLQESVAVADSATGVS